MTSHNDVPKQRPKTTSQNNVPKQRPKTTSQNNVPKQHPTTTFPDIDYLYTAYDTRVITTYHNSSQLITTYHNSSQLITTHHNLSQLITSQHDSSYLITTRIAHMIYSEQHELLHLVTHVRHGWITVTDDS